MSKSPIYLDDPGAGTKISRLAHNMNINLPVTFLSLEGWISGKVQHDYGALRGIDDPLTFHIRSTETRRGYPIEWSEEFDCWFVEMPRYPLPLDQDPGPKYPKAPKFNPENPWNCVGAHVYLPNTKSWEKRYLIDVKAGELFRRYDRRDGSIQDNGEVSLAIQDAGICHLTGMTRVIVGNIHEMVFPK